MTPRQQQTYDLIAGRQPISISEIAAEMQITKGSAEQHLHVLRNHGYIRPVGRSKAARWVLCEAPVRWITGDPLIQAASVWDYARRCGA